MTDWRDKIRNPNCELCPLHEEAQHVCLMGDGKRSSDIMIVGEAPGKREDETHRAFVGKAGRLLDEMLEEHAQLSRDDVYITNVAKCRPPKNRTPDRKEIKTCVEEYFWEELKKQDPKFILTLGNSALQGVIGKSGITKHRGTRWELDDTVVMASFHPAAVLRNPRHGTALAADMQRFGRLVRGEEAGVSTKVRIIRNARQLAWLLRELRDTDDFSYDIETNSLQEYRSDSVIVSIAFTWIEGEAAFVPLHHNQTPWKKPEKVLDALAPYLKSKKVKHVAHNGKFDARYLKHFKIPVPQTFDTMLAAHMLDENRSKGLKPLSQLLLGADAYDLGDELGEGKAAQVSLRRLAIYNCKDTDYTHRLYHTFKEELKKEPRIARVFAKLMMPASNALVDVERRGFQVDWERWLERSAVVNRNCEKLEKHMLKAVPRGKRAEFNFNSSQQVSEWLFKDLDLPIIEETDKGHASSKESVLLQLEKKHKAVAALLKWRKWNKFRTTYIGPWAGWVDDNMRIHPVYKLFGTVTGRLSCVDPNMQQVPRDPFIRSIITAPKGFVLIKADYSQIELRIAAMLAHERTMLRLFSQGADIHMNTAVDMTNKVPADIEKEERKKAKAVNFGFLYTMGADKFVEYARDNYGVEFTDAEANRYRNRFFAAYPMLQPWHDRQRRLAHRYHRVHSPIGRVRHLPDIVSADRGVRNEAERQAINSPVQSFASDLMLLSLVQLCEISDKQRKPDFYVTGTVHDELLFWGREDRVDEACTTIRDVMMDMDPVKRKFGTHVTVPIEVEVEVGSHWSEGEVWQASE